jgi:hypothetical protein
VDIKGPNRGRSFKQVLYVPSMRPSIFTADPNLQTSQSEFATPGAERLITRNLRGVQRSYLHTVWGFLGVAT